MENIQEYELTYDGKTYKFRSLSDFDVIKNDKDILTDVEARDKKYFRRTLRMLFSSKMPGAQIVMPLTRYKTERNILILYKGYIIDYYRNIVMKKDDYYDLFKVKELNRLDKYDIYRLNQVRKELDFVEDNLFYAFREVIDDISRNFPLFEKFDSMGFCESNRLLYSCDGDSCFNTDEDRSNFPYLELQNELDDFTKNPNENTEHITILDEDLFELKSDDFGECTFRLLSNLLNIPELLTENRYQQCHSNSKKVGYKLQGMHGEIYIVAGMISKNDKEKNHHSWVEVEYSGLALVFDYNHNLVMKRDQYYKLYGTEVVEKTHIDDYKKLLNNLDIAFKKVNFSIINYFTSELSRDFKRLEKIINK